MLKLVIFCRKIFVLVILIVGTITSLGAVTHAADQPNKPVLPTSGITVAPALLTAQIGSKQPQTTTTIGVRNNFEVPVTVSAELNGFDVRNNALIPTTTSEKTLSGVVTLSPSEIIIEPGLSKNITVNVHDTSSLSPGGHYLSILLTETAVNGKLDSSQLALRPAVSATLYVIKEDGAVRSLQARSLQLKHSLFSIPKLAEINFYNDGNVSSTPRGVLQLRRGGEETVFAQSIVNQRSAPLYPQANFTLQTRLQKLSAVRFPGRYNAYLQYRYDGQDNVESLDTNFWYLPKSFVITILLLLTGLGLGLWPENQRRIRRYWRRLHHTRRKAFVAPDPDKIANVNRFNSDISGAKKQPVSRRRKIDDIQKIK